MSNMTTRSPSIISFTEMGDKGLTGRIHAESWRQFQTGVQLNCLFIFIAIIQGSTTEIVAHPF